MLAISSGGRQRGNRAMANEQRQIAVVQRFSSQELELMRKTVAKGASAEQFALFLEMCKHYGLNPLTRQIYCIIDKQGRMIIQTSIDGFRLMAERTQKYAGQLGPLWCGEDGEWKDVWLKKEPPAAAKVGILRRDFVEPVWSVARFSSYSLSTPTWQKMPDNMLAKCAESLAFRRAFPAQMGGIYTQEEMAQAHDDPQIEAQAHSVHVEEVHEAPVVEAEPVQLAEAGLHKQIGDLKKRAKDLGVASNAGEWQDLLDYLKLTEVSKPVHISRISGHLEGVERQQQQKQKQHA